VDHGIGGFIPRANTPKKTESPVAASQDPKAVLGFIL
jgi:hypothetical protein